MRQNFYELLAKREFNAKKEFLTLWKLFCEEGCYYTDYSSYSMAEWVNEIVFRDLPFRGSFTSLKEMMDELGITACSLVTI